MVSLLCLRKLGLVVLQRMKCMMLHDTFCLEVGATSLSSCACVPGFVNEEGSCEACGIGFVCPRGSDRRQPCAASQTTHTNTAGSLSDCTCKPGTFLQNGLCAPCPLGYFKPSAGDDECSQCGDGTYSNHTGATQPCLCAAGYGFDDTSGRCMACVPGEYKAGIGNLPCSRCSPEKSSEAAATSALDCRCRAGLAAEGSMCRECSEGFFCPGKGEELACPGNATSRAADGLFVHPWLFLEGGQLRYLPSWAVQANPGQRADLLTSMPNQCSEFLRSHQPFRLLLYCRIFCRSGFRRRTGQVR